MRMMMMMLEIRQTRRRNKVIYSTVRPERRTAKDKGRERLGMISIIRLFRRLTRLVNIFYTSNIDCVIISIKCQWCSTGSLHVPRSVKKHSDLFTQSRQLVSTIWQDNVVLLVLGYDKSCVKKMLKWDSKTEEKKHFSQDSSLHWSLDKICPTFHTHNLKF